MSVTTRFTKRAEAVSHDTPSLSHSDLVAKRSAIEAELKTLTSERDALALKAVAGDERAQSTIDSIDRDRQRKGYEIETINAALRALAQRAPADDTAARFKQRLPSLKRTLAYVVKERRESNLFAVQRGHWRNRNSGEIGHFMHEADPITVARELVEPLARRQQVMLDQRADPDKVEKAQREQRQHDAARKAEIDRLAQELVAATDIPPLPAELAAFVGR